MSGDRRDRYQYRAPALVASASHRQLVRERQIYLLQPSFGRSLEKQNLIQTPIKDSYLRLEDRWVNSASHAFHRQVPSSFQIHPQVTALHLDQTNSKLRANKWPVTDGVLRQKQNICSPLEKELKLKKVTRVIKRERKSRKKELAFPFGTMLKRHHSLSKMREQEREIFTHGASYWWGEGQDRRTSRLFWA